MKESLRDMKDYVQSPNEYAIEIPEWENRDNLIRGNT